MSENAFVHAVPDRMHDDHRTAAEAKAGLSVYRRACRSAAASLAGSIAALALSGCPIGSEGGGAPVGTIGAAASARNIEARNAQMALEQQQRQQVLEARRIERREAALEAVRQRQIAADKIALQQEQEKAHQAQQQQQANQGNQGKHLGQTGQQPGQGPKDHIPPGQAKK